VGAAIQQTCAKGAVVKLFDYAVISVIVLMLVALCWAIANGVALA
jgi:hypothetical protein